MLSVSRSAARTASRLLGALAVLSAAVASGVLLFPDPLADAFFAGIVLLAVGFALVGAVGAWTNRTPLVWVAGLLSSGLAVLGMMSIGLFVAPTALLLLGAALASQLAGPRAGVREGIVDDPPTVPEAVLKTLTGTAAAVVGAALVYVGAVRRELFGACASETLACALDRTHWDAVGIAVLGLVAIAIGGWLVWKQVYVSRVLASTETR